MHKFANVIVIQFIKVEFTCAQYDIINECPKKAQLKRGFTMCRIFIAMSYLHDSVRTSCHTDISALMNDKSALLF